MKRFNYLVQAAKQHIYVSGAVFVVAAVAIVGVGYHIVHGDSSTAPAARAGRAGQQVTVASVASLSPDTAAISVIGQVSSENEATVLTQVSGEIVNVDVKLGDQVSAGDTIATMENSAQQASVLQEQGAYDAAEVTLSEANGTTAANSSVTSSQATQNLLNAETGADAALLSAYTALDDAVHTKADQLFSNPRTQFPSLNPVLTYSDDTDLFVTIVNERKGLEAVLSDADSLANNATTTNVDDSVAGMIADAHTVDTFLSDLSDAVNEVSIDQTNSAQISAYQTTVGAARTETATAISNLTTAKTTYDSANATAATAQNSSTGGTANSIAAAQASVQQALGALDAAKSALQKTIITSPISGTIVDLPLTNGDYLSSFSEAAKISNPSALKITAYVTADDAQTLSVGNAATVNGSQVGVITAIAPAIDPQTGTIEVDIGLTGSQAGLIDGDSVTVDLTRSVAPVASAASANASSTAQVIIPIVALKIMPTGPVVFTVDPIKKTLVSHPVEIGSILGENIVVTKGLTPNMLIVTDARGLVAGQSVTVKK